MTKFQVGELVEVLNADKIVGADEEGIKTGDVVEVTAIDRFGDPLIKGLHLYNWELQYIRKVEPKPTKNQRISALEKEVAELKKVVEDMQKPSTLTEDIWDFPPREIAEHPTSLRETVLDMAGKALDRQLRESVLPQSNNQKRAAIIEKAKRFVEEYERRMGYTAAFPYAKFNRVLTVVKFVVDSDKNTVVSIITPKYKSEGSQILAKGIAKCHPHDVFNEHIGKAIALGTALGLDVSEFEQAVQPDEVVVGMEIQYNEDFANYPNEKRIIKSIEGETFYFTNGKNFSEFWNDVFLNNARITNDTNARYEEAQVHESNKAF